ncbi:LTA synthase family protein [endosymbiont 'TC1' of Trimyema compressum]|uniref:LTA synthase family protein n=1 Tax=endosymbiont 'TC1' of Trimyema compressum TaxID=243899 RepID=UPI00155F0DA9|nr:LTA synthase family protein [endosymbiont 'TC1' of Trimyema compressum]
MVILGIASKVKYDFRGTGPSPADFLTLGEAGEMAGVLTPGFILSILLYVILIAIIAMILIKKMRLPKISSKNKLKGIVGFFLFFFFVYSFSPEWIVIRGGSVPIKATVNETGAPVYFFSQFNNPVKLKAPNENEIQTAFSHELSTIKYNKNNSKEKPDIIVIQNESFFDPTETMDISKFSEDPLPYFHKIQKKSDSFSVTSPVFGGGTANAEFEMITGLSTVFFPAEMTVFSGYLNKPTISLGSILREQGYYSYLLHPFFGNFYKRNQVYRLLGFNEFDSLETMVDNDPTIYERGLAYPGSQYINDIELTNQIINRLEKNENAPKFIFAVTMQGHVPYGGPEKYAITYNGNDIENPEYLEEFNSYLTSLRATDESIKELIEYLGNREKPSIVAFYGDHQPSLKFRNLANFQMSNAEDTLKKLSSGENHKMHKVPAFIWSNSESLKTTEETIDMTSLGEKVLSAAKSDMPNYFHILKTMREKEKINSFTDYYIVKDNIFYHKDTDEYKMIYDKYRLIDSDILGKFKFIETDPNKWFVKNNNNYIVPKLTK